MKILKISLGNFCCAELVGLFDTYPHISHLFAAQFEEIIIDGTTIWFTDKKLSFNNIPLASANTLIGAYSHRWINLRKLNLHKLDLNTKAKKNARWLLHLADKIYCGTTQDVLNINAISPYCLKKIVHLQLDHNIQLNLIKSLFQNLSNVEYLLGNYRVENLDILRELSDSFQTKRLLKWRLPLVFPEPQNETWYDYQILQSCVPLKPYFCTTVNTPKVEMLPDLNGFISLAGFNNIGRLTLWNNQSDEIISNLSFLKKLNNLEFLLISGNFIIDFNSVGSLKTLTHLNQIILKNCQVETEWLNSCLPTLKKLTTSYIDIFRGPGEFNVPSSLEKLTISNSFQASKHLDLRNVNFRNSNITHLNIVMHEIATDIYLKNKPHCLELLTFQKVNPSVFSIGQNFDISVDNNTESAITNIYIDDFESGILKSNLLFNCNYFYN